MDSIRAHMRYGTIFHSDASDNIANLVSIKHQKRKRSIGVDGRR